MSVIAKRRWSASASSRRTGDVNLRNALVEEFSWVARHCARRFADRGEPFDDLIQVGMLGVLKAVGRFDPEHGSSFVSFALPTVLGELRRHFRDATWAVRVPRRLKDLHVEVGATIDFLGTEKGRPPTPDDVAAHLGIPVEHVLEALDAGAAYRSTSAQPQRRARRRRRAGGCAARRRGRRSRARRRSRAAASGHRGPAPRERRILELRFAEGLSQSEIADMVGVSQVHVSRLLRKSIRMLQEQLGHSGDPADADDVEDVEDA